MFGRGVGGPKDLRPRRALTYVEKKRHLFVLLIKGYVAYL